MSLRIAQCCIKDIALLQKVALQTFIEAFEKDNNPEDFQSYIQTVFSKKQLLKEVQHPLSQFYFLSLGNKVIGYIKINFGVAQNE